MSSLELSSEFKFRQKTCWLFKSKVQRAMESSLDHPVTGTIHVDEFMVGGPEENKKGRSKGLKTPNYLFSKYIRDNKLAFNC